MIHQQATCHKHDRKLKMQVAESEEEVRELQAQTVQFSERVVRLQTLVQVHDWHYVQSHFVLTLI